jgi:hypothetical protein
MTIIHYLLKVQYMHSEEDSEDLKRIKTKFGIFMLWALAASVHQADIDIEDLKILQNMASDLKQPSISEANALRNVRAALLAEIRKLVPEADLPGALFADGFNLDMSFINAVIQSYRSEARIRQAA